MSFLTPARMQDASRILRGVALVAAKAAADSPALRRAGQGDLSNALKEVLKSVSQQSKAVAEILDATSREQTGNSMEHHMRSSREAVESVASVLSDRAQGAMQEGQRAAQSAMQQPQTTAEGLVREGQRFFESASRSAQQMAQQGQEFAERAAPRATQAAKDAVRDAQSAGQKVGQAAEQSLTGAGPDSGHKKAMTLDFSGGSGTATGASMLPEDTVSNFTDATSSNVGRTSMHVTAHGGSLKTQASEASPLPSSIDPPRAVSDALSSLNPVEGTMKSDPPRAVREALSSLNPLEPTTRSNQAEPSQNGLNSMESASPPLQQAAPVPAPGREFGSDLPEVAPIRPVGDASEILKSHSESGRASSAQTINTGSQREKQSPDAASEAARLLEEERKLSEKESQVSGPEKVQVQAKKEEVRKKLKERRVPSSPIGRVAGFAQLGASLLYGTMADQVSGYFGGKTQEKGGNRYLTERNAERLADALCRMRGAALKLGQMISIQDDSVLPPQLAAAFERVRAGADVMPRKQLHKVLVDELGPDWRSKVADFEDEPLAAASIGQVHGATLHDGRRVVMKIQYPGVARSIESDVDNLLRIISLANILPKGLYIENAAKVAKKELKLECDYGWEARCQARFVQLIDDDPDFKDVMHVPKAVPELCSSSVLCSERVAGVHIDKVAQMSQPIRDAVGTLLLQLTLKELFEWRFMQTDPNWGNFLYDEAAGKLNLIDFGAAREFPTKFVDDYLSMVKACAERDRDRVIDYSTRLGFLTGDESKVMLDAHSNAGFVVGTPFSQPGLYDFASHSSLTKQVSQLGAVMLKHRLTPPPEDSYSLHRKLSGAFLACIKLRAKVPCNELFFSAYKKHKWGHEGIKAEDLPKLELASA